MAEVKFKISAEDKATAVLERMAANGTNVTDRLQGAFDKLGIRSADSIESSRREIVSAFERIKNSGVASADEIERAHKAMQGKLDDLSERGARKRMGSWDQFRKHAIAAIGAIGATYAASAFARNLVEVNSEFQQLNASLVTVTGSQAAANKEFAWLEQFATTTPYQLSDVTSAFVKLKAMGLEPSAESLRSYGNTAAAMGKSLDQMIEAVADAATGEFERLKEFGIKAKSEGENVTFTFKGVETTVQKSSEAIQQYLLSLGNTDFASGMQNQMDTIQGAFSNLKDEWEAMLREIGDEGLSDAIQESLQQVTAMLKDGEFRASVREFSTNVAALLPKMVEASQGILDLFNAIDSGLRKLAALMEMVGLKDSPAAGINFNGQNAALVAPGWVNPQQVTDAVWQERYGASRSAVGEFLGLEGGGVRRVVGADGSVSYSNQSRLFPGMSTSYAVGTAYVPRTGLYQLHRGEEVRTRGEAARGSGPVSVAPVFNITVNESRGGQQTAREIARQIEPELRQLASRYRN